MEADSLRPFETLPSNTDTNDDRMGTGFLFYSKENFRPVQASHSIFKKFIRLIYDLESRV